MKRWAPLILTLAMPLSSPLACGGDACVRNSDCSADKMCSSAGQCVLRDPPPAEVAGAGGEDATPTSGGTTSGSGGHAGSSGSAGSAGNAGTTSQAGSDDGSEPMSSGGAGGETSAGGAGGANDSSAGGA